MDRNAFIHHATNAMTITGGNHKGIAESKIGKLARDIVRVLAINFIGDKHDGTFVRPQGLGDILIGGGSTTLGINQKKYKVCLTDGLVRLVCHWLFNTIDIVSGNTTGIDNNITEVAHCTFAILSVTGKPCELRNNCITGTGQPIKQRGFADVRSAYKCNNGNHYERTSMANRRPPFVMT